MKRPKNGWMAVVIGIAVSGCGGDDIIANGTDSAMSLPDGGSSGSDAVAGGDLTVTPPEVTLDLASGGPAVSQVYVAKLSDGTDVSSMAQWTLDDPTLGTLSGSTFTTGTMHGGTTIVRATFQGKMGYATVHVKLHANVTTMTCPGCPAFPPDNTPACMDMTRSAMMLYPTDGTIVPPNMNVIETQFDQGKGNTLFEIDFENAATDVRVETRCNVINDVRTNLATSGCAYDLDQTVWDFLAQSNRGGDPLTITVRATDDSGACVATSPGRKISFATEDLLGGIYYWQSVVYGGVQGATGGIFRYDFGARGQKPTAFLSPSANVGTCVGCHFLSRDGQKMSYGADDPDADDEYGDLHASLLDVQSFTVSAQGKVPPGFQTFSPDHKLFLASDGRGMNKSPAFFLFDGNTGAAAVPATVSSGASRGTHPDWSPDGSSIVFVQPKSFLSAMMMMMMMGTMGDDEHFVGGSLYTMSYANGNFGAPAALLTSQGENNYYPTYSPDGQFIAFNRAPSTGKDVTDDAFSNVKARALLLPAKGGNPIDMPALNDNGDLTNSWPRFSPSVQMYKGHQIVWVTFSSTRDYGDRVRNSTFVNNLPQVNCYPSESPQNPMGSKMQPLGPECHQPQIWMAAIDLTVAASGKGDPSYPAFWLPFQDVTSHNHIAQWVTTIVTQPPPDGGVTPDGGCVPPVDNKCVTTQDCCGAGICENGMCGIP